MSPEIKFKNESLFLKILKRRVETYLNGNITGNYKLYTKTAIILTVATGLYLLPFLVSLSVGLYVLVAVLRGWFMGLIGFNIGHDAIHGSYSKSKWWNTLMGYSFDASGVSSYNWFHKHNILHHTYTNIDGKDDDIETNELLRLSPVQKWHWIHRFQFIYAFVLYGFLHLQWVFYNDIQKYRRSAIGSTPIPRMDKKEFHIFLWSKIIYVGKSLVVPIILLGFWQGIISFLVMEFTCGLTISVVFQLAHIQNKSLFIGTSHEWAYHQLETTADFATRNPIISWLLGGLNFQAIHHLLPKVSHVHYPNIQKIVIQTCKEFNVEYRQYKTMIGAVVDHISYLWRMGKRPQLQFS